MREKSLPVKAGFKTTSEVQKSSSIFLTHPNTLIEYLSKSTTSLHHSMKESPQHSLAITFATSFALSWMPVKRPLLLSVNAGSHTAQLTCIPNIKKSNHKPEAVDFQGFHNQKDKIRDILILSHSFPERFPGSEADIHKVLDSCTAELTEDDLGEMTGCSEPDDEDPGAVVQRPWLITRDLTKTNSWTGA